ncbi:5-methylcytosine restriction system specificity protein McrC [Ligilactobacillus acidipiscis]|uniref:5-methylcytosine restriction system specificity protein McrC n=1 Tax=Ligilactobacillus acidipiscis TaxID=89059 RepID=UPI0023F9845C|nr:3-isopropylmalate dehydrogenase [Ligilactobacillus acidipiscis]WEV56242.1 3-isopropylmalate dehydrogenase [Ligilactobacillus acidipiscis]
MRIKDNSTYAKSDFISRFPKLAQMISDKTLADLSENNNFLIFPKHLVASEDLENDSKIIETINDQALTHNVIGIVGTGKERLVIHSRFSKGSDNFFLRYILQKVLNINLINMDSSLSIEEQYYQLLIYLFPKYLNAAMRKGLFKTYRRFKYNDANLKGPIEIARQIKSNTPFVGKIAYSTREFSKDNELMELIRHTIEYIKTSTYGETMLLNLTERTKQNVQAVVQNTFNYSPMERRKIIAANRVNPIRHAYYSEYRALQKLCLMILTQKNHSFGKRQLEFYGILFDVSWLWEEYLSLLLKEQFVHPRNRKKQLGFKLYAEMFENHNNRKVYPDFYSKEHKIVLDAKYKKIDTSISRSDLYQIITYAHIFKAQAAGLIYPSNLEMKNHLIGELNGNPTKIFRQAFQVPQNVTSYQEFVEKFRISEKTVLEELMKVVDQN